MTSSKDFWAKLQQYSSEPICEVRKRMEKKYGPTRFKSYWPFIGRRDPGKLLTSAEIEKDLDKALKSVKE